MSSFINILFLCLAEIIGDFGFKDYAYTASKIGFSIGVIGYIFVIFFLIQSLKNSTVLSVNAQWDGLSALLESLAAIFILHESFKHNHQYIGVALIILGLFLLRWG